MSLIYIYSNYLKKGSRDQDNKKMLAWNRVQFSSIVCYKTFVMNLRDCHPQHHKEKDHNERPMKFMATR